VSLPGIGETLADRIIAYREANGPFQTIEDLQNVVGIGEKKLDQIAGLVGVGG
jgi:competence protein ComEA